MEKINRNKGIYKRGGKLVPIYIILDYAYVQDYFLAYYGVYKRIIRLWSCTTINTIESRKP
jgi:hypothetical protein